MDNYLDLVFNCPFLAGDFQISPFRNLSFLKCFSYPFPLRGIIPGTYPSPILFSLIPGHPLTCGTLDCPGLLTSSGNLELSRPGCSLQPWWSQSWWKQERAHRKESFLWAHHSGAQELVVFQIVAFRTFRLTYTEPQRLYLFELFGFL